MAQVAVAEGDEHVGERAYKIQAMLPWGFESKLALSMAVVKIPFMVLVAVVGMYSESHLKEMTQTTWLRYGNSNWLWGGKVGCYAHRIMETVPKKTLIEFGLVSAFNNSLMGGRLRTDVWKSNSSVEVDPLNIGHKDTCEVDLRNCRVHGLQHPGFFTGGIDHFFSFAVIWLIYKVLFIGLHPIDRLVLKMKGDPPAGPAYPEPLVKLLTEPYFQFCTTWMQVIVKCLFYFRYKMMPNTLLGALASMHSLEPDCPRIVYYRMSPRFGNLCYFLCLLDLVSISGAYAYCKVKMDGRLIGKWRYRIWKTGWLASALFFTYLAIKATMMTFGGIIPMIHAIFATFFVLLFRLDFSFSLNLDLLRVMTFLILFFEAMELAFLVATILGPKVAPQLYKRFPWLKPENQQYEELPDTARE